MSDRNANERQPQLVHTHDVQLDADYTNWIIELKARYHSAQLKAAVKVNAEKLLFNWQLGRDLVQKKAEERWGAGVVEQVSLDLRNEFPHDKGFSATNLWDMKRWYLFYTQNADGEKLRQPVGELQVSGIQYASKLRQLVGELSEDQMEQMVNDYLAVQFPCLLSMIPWGHHVKIIHKCATVSEAIFYMKATIANGWSRVALERAIDSGLYSSQPAALTNFGNRLPQPQDALAQDLVKSTYDFSFAEVQHSEYSETELEDALCNNITQLLLELGNGFAFIGRQQEVMIAGKDRFVDLLFYHIRLRRYVVVELKARPFQPEYASKLNFYVNAVNRYVKLPEDEPTIGLLICSDMNETEVELSFEGIQTPMGVATYTDPRIREFLPSREQITQRIKAVKQELRHWEKLKNKTK